MARMLSTLKKRRGRRKTKCKLKTMSLERSRTSTLPTKKRLRSSRKLTVY